MSVCAGVEIFGQFGCARADVESSMFRTSQKLARTSRGREERETIKKGWGGRAKHALCLVPKAYAQVVGEGEREGGRNGLGGGGKRRGQPTHNVGSTCLTIPWKRARKPSALRTYRVSAASVCHLWVGVCVGGCVCACMRMCTCATVCVCACVRLYVCVATGMCAPRS